MALSINHVTLAGNLTRDAEYKQTQVGTNICNFSIAVSKNVKDANGNWTSEAEFFDCTLFGNLGASFQQNNSLSKGTPVVLEGRLQVEKWQDKTTGEGRQKVSVIANTVIPYSRNNNQQPSQQQTQYQQQVQQPAQQQVQYQQPVSPQQMVSNAMGGNINQSDIQF